VERIRAVLPPEAELGIASDDAVFVRGSIREVLVTLGISALIVIGIILVFLRSGSATLIPAVTLPVALVGTFGGIWAAGFSVNLLTLLALVLATGLVVDDAIIVLENVMRRRALGLGPRAAALAGTREVFFAVIATTATLAAVFIPISFLPGQAGGLFREFGYVLAIAVTISSVVALTLCPMLAARILPPPDTGRRRGLLGHAAAGVGNLLSGLYRRLLRGALAAPLLVVALSLLFSVSAVLLWRTVPQEVTPREDRGVVLISLTAPQGVSLDYTDAQLRKVEAVLEPIRARGDAETVFAFAGFGGPNTGFVVMTLAPWGERALSQDAIVGEIAPALAAIPGIRAFPIQPNSLGIRGGGRGLQFALAGADYASLQTLAQELVRALEATGRFQGVRLSAEPTQPQVTVAVDRERASDLGINLSGLSRAIQSVLDGRQVGTLYRDDGTTPIKLVSTGTQIDDPGDLENIFLRTASGQIVPMSSIATLSESAAPANLQRESKLRSVPVTAGLPPGFAIRDALALVEATAAGMLPPGVRIVPLAEAATLGETSRGLAVTFAIALIVVLLVLAAQFESFLSALIIMLTVPLGLACAVWAIHLSGGSLNVYSQIGLVLLVGVMAKNGILIVEFANQLRERGLGVRDAIEQASLIRVRAVVMTAISTVLGGLPLIFAEGPGAEARIALGWVVVGGLGFATLATLFLTPVCYLWIARFARPRRDEDARTAAELAAARGPARAAG
jgi:HAE1 family hydrophobic/amphiphilic exporter-1